MFWYFSKIDTRWVCFLQIITRWKHFGIFFKSVSGEFVLFKLLPGEIFFDIFGNWKLIDGKQKLSNVQRIRYLKKKMKHVERTFSRTVKFSKYEQYEKRGKGNLTKDMWQKESKVMLSTLFDPGGQICPHRL